MKQTVIALILSTLWLPAYSQLTAKDLFSNKEVPVYYLGVDYSHVKLIGEFAQFYNLGEQSSRSIRNEYFPAWNMVVVNEREKYDIADMLRREQVLYSIDMLMQKNKETSLEDLEAYNEPNYSADDIEGFIKEYQLENGKSGIGVAFLAESLNKATNEAIYHFVAIDMSTGSLLFQRKLYGKPSGFGLRNYWVGSVHDVIKKIDNYEYRVWKKEFE